MRTVARRAEEGTAIVSCAPAPSADSPGNAEKSPWNVKWPIVGRPRSGSANVRTPFSSGRRRVYERTSRTLALASMGKTRAEKRLLSSVSRSAGSRIWCRISS